MRRPFYLLAALLLAAPLWLRAQQSPQLKLDIPALAARADEVSEVTLDGPVLRLGLAFINSDEKDMDPAARGLLSRLKGIYVRSYEFHHQVTVNPADLDTLHQQLKQGGWSRIVNVRSRRDGENDEVYVRTAPSGATILGLVVISVQPDEVDLVNIVGDIKPAELAALGGHLGIPAVETTPAGKKH